MRLIDAEHLINKAEQEKKDGLLDDDELETIYYELSDEPTVDAIPVEWIQNILTEIGNDSPFRPAIEWLLLTYKMGKED